MEDLIYLIQTPPFWLKTPPLSLAYLKTYLQKKGIKTNILDLNMGLFRLSSLPLKRWLTLDDQFEKNLFYFIEKRYPDFLEHLYKKIEPASFVGFSLTKRNLPFTFRLAEKIVQKYPQKNLIFGGPQTLFLKKTPEFSLPSYWVIGEGEIPLSEIIQNQKNRFYYFREISDLDTLDFYDFQPLDIKFYSSYLPLFSSRGCPFKCNFCTENKLSVTYRQHSALYMVEQIKYLQKKYNVNNFVFCDSLINYHENWLKDFCLLLIKKRLKINWEAQARITEKFSFSTAKLMKKSGCYNLFIGLESGSDKILKKMNKGFTTLMAQKFLETLHKADVHFEISLIFGYPGESQKEFSETINFITKNKKNIPKIAQANPFIDYFQANSNKNRPKVEMIKRIEKFLNVMRSEDIKYTKSFINNLLYFS
ncbi:MAG: radical SAM protein [Candidatus Omnitrophica bacterium]|jgi:radical SAM superfamily enzyme YgiQ (UPF0313 family)|nr:radical SAM protein [Candidatus Omnitrophota bacterium]